MKIIVFLLLSFNIFALWGGDISDDCLKIPNANDLTYGKNDRFACHSSMNRYIFVNSDHRQYRYKNETEILTNNNYSFSGLNDLNELAKSVWEQIDNCAYIKYRDSGFNPLIELVDSAFYSRKYMFVNTEEYYISELAKRMFFENDFSCNPEDLEFKITGLPKNDISNRIAHLYENVFQFLSANEFKRSYDLLAIFPQTHPFLNQLIIDAFFKYVPNKESLEKKDGRTYMKNYMGKLNIESFDNIRSEETETSDYEFLGKSIENLATNFSTLNRSQKIALNSTLFLEAMNLTTCSAIGLWPIQNFQALFATHNFRLKPKTKEHADMAYFISRAINKKWSHFCMRHYEHKVFYRREKSESYLEQRLEALSEYIK